MLTFRTSITFAVMAFIVALTALLIAIQLGSLRWATQEAASAYMKTRVLPGAATCCASISCSPPLNWPAAM